MAGQLSTERTVRVSPAPNTTETRPLCDALIAALPDKLGELKARTVDGDAKSTAAWGDPPVALRCGGIAVPRPLGDVATLDGVQWAPISGKRNVTWTTVGRAPAVQVQVPKSYDSQAPLLADLSAAIKKTLPTAP